MDGNNTFNNVTFANHGIITGNNTFNNLTFSPGFTYTLTSARTQTITGILTANGTCTSGITIVSNSPTVSTTISKSTGSVTLDYVSLTRITASGGATFTANNSIDGGNNAGWTINAGAAGLNLYWIGNGGNWNDGNRWSTTSGGAPYGCSPRSLDNVFFDANSFSAAGQTVTINVATASCRNMNWTGVTNIPTFASANTNTLNIHGSLTLVPGMTLTSSGFLAIVNLQATATGQTLTMAGKAFGNFVNFNGIGGGWILQDGLTTTSDVFLNNGTLNTNNQTVTARMFNSNNTNVRALNMGSSVFNLSYALWFWEVSNGTNLTLDAGTSTINGIVGQAGFSQSFRGGGKIYNNLNFNATINNGGTLDGNNTFNNVTFVNHGIITGNNTFNNLTFSPGFTYTLTSARTQTITGNLTANGTCTSGITIVSNSPSVSTTISKSTGSVTLNSVTLTRITAIGGATFTANNSLDGGNNSGWTINAGGAGQDLYWIGNGGNWNDGNRWSINSGGAPYGCSPGSGDNVFFDANSFSSAGQTVTINVATASCRNMTWTGVTNTPTFASAGTNTLRIHGSLTLASGMTLTSSGFLAIVNFEATSTGQTLTTAGKSFGNLINFNGIGGEWTLQDALTTTSDVFLNNGTLNTNNQTVTARMFNSNNTNVRALNMGSSVFNLSYALWFWEVSNGANLTLNAGTSTINGIVGQVGFSQSFRGGGKVYNNLNFNATINTGGQLDGNNTFNNVTFLNNGAITGNNTFNTLTFTPAYTYTITNGRNQTILVDLNISGTGSFPVRIQSVLAGSPYTFTKSSGVVCVDFIRISDNTATGGATFNAGLGSQDLGGNTGWDFPGVSVAAVNLLASINPICDDGSENTILTQTGGTLGNLAYWQWYTNAAYTVPVGGQLVSADASLSVNPLTPTTYYLRVEWPECITPLASPLPGLTINQQACSGGIFWVGGAGSGAERTNWNNANNWLPVGVPANGTDVNIPNTTHKPTISGISPIVNDIIIYSGAVLTITNIGSLSVSGELTNNGVLTVNSGGALVQTVGSTIAGTGTYNIRRQFPGSGVNSRFIGSPINDIAANGISGISASGVDGAQVVPLADCNPNSIAQGSPYGNILELREIPAAQVLSNCSQSLWFVKSAGILENVRGYIVRANGGQTITFSGSQVNNGDKSLTGLIRETGTVNDHLSVLPVGRGWQLVANPYPSPIAIPENYLSAQGFDNQIHLWNSATGSWVSNIATPGNPVIIAVGQGFEIRKSDESGNSTLSFTNALRVANTGVSYFGADEFGDYRLRIDLSGNNFTDKTTMFFHPEATPGFDPIFDINKMIGSSTSPALFTMAGIERMAYNGLPLLTQPIIIPMVFYPGTSGTYTLEFSQLETLPPTAMVYLEDKKTGIWTNVRAQNAYTFTSLTSDNIQRFNIHFEPPLSSTVLDESCQLNDGIIQIINPSNETWTVSVLNNGNEVYHGNVAHGTTSINNLISGIYTIYFTNNAYTLSEEKAIEAGTPVDAAFAMSSETLQAYDILTASVTNPLEGAVYSWYINELYAGIGTSTSFAIADMGTYIIRLDASLGNCKSSLSQSFNVEGTTSIIHVEKDDLLRAFPNPANEMVTLVWNDNSQIFETVRITDISGRAIRIVQIERIQQGNQLQLDLRDISEGIYLINLEGNDVRKTVKVSVVK